MAIEVHHLRSESVGDEFVISVGRCAPPGREPTQVLILTDALTSFGAALDMAHIPVGFGEMPPLWVVGIGYPGTSFRDCVAPRTRDYTPTPVADRPDSGGAPAFLDFIRGELLPWLAGRCGADVGQAAYFGHSLGGLFGAWVLTHAPETFTRYGLSSPSLWWDNGGLFGQEADYAATHEDLAARVLITVGEREQPAAQPARIATLPEAERAAARAQTATARRDMVTGARMFADALASRGYRGLRSEFQVLAGESHRSAHHVAIGRSLRYLWELSD